MIIHNIHRSLCGLVIAMALSLAGQAWGGDCVVGSNSATGPDGLIAAIEKAYRGECRVQLSADLRQRYEVFVPVTPSVQLIRIPKSAVISIGQALPVLHAIGGETLIVMADKPATVQLSGKAYSAIEPPIQISGQDGNVILDGIELHDFPITAIEVAGRDTLMIEVKVSESGNVGAPAVHILGSHNVVAMGGLSHNNGDAIRVDDGLGINSCGTPPQGVLTRLVQNKITDNSGAGIRVHAPQAVISDNMIHHNQGAGVVVMSAPGDIGCKDAKAAFYTAELRKNRIFDNADGIVISENGLVPPVDLIDLSAPTATAYHLIGNIGRDRTKGYPWDDAHLNLKGAIVDIFLGETAKGRQAIAYLTSASVQDAKARFFSIHIPKPLVIKGKEVLHPVFTATLTDPEHHNTSRLSDPLDVEASQDWDHDGIPNAQEDLNQDGVVTLESGETDPRLPDTDGDGLTDGEERLHTGKIAEIQGQQLKAVNDPNIKVPFASFKDLSRLQPTVSDSDGDCLPDGLELGVAAFEWPLPAQAEYSVLQSPSPKLPDGCLELLKSRKLYQVDLNTVEKNIFLIKNILLRDPSLPATLGNLLGIYDLDPTSTTDPTHKDSDDDEWMDGAEDWNWDGARNKKDGKWLEADPNQKDSDGDGLLDGDEEKNKTSPLLTDTDRDGVSDAQELRQGGNPALCDSDGDGVPDGVENNLSNTNAPEGCPGAPIGGTNFAAPSVLSSSKVDSDGEGLKDGDEDKNHNGWLDPNESDPTTSDTDGDGISDDVEMSGDNDHDGSPDFFVGDINNGARCNPPKTIDDVDCDGLSNAQDTDSDNDGCPDRTEGMEAGNNPHGIPAAFNREAKQCGGNGSGGPTGGGGVAAGGSAKAEPKEEAAWNAFWSNRSDGGGDCSLLRHCPTQTPPIPLFFLAGFGACVLVTARVFTNPKS